MKIWYQTQVWTPGRYIPSVNRFDTKKEAEAQIREMKRIHGEKIRTEMIVLQLPEEET